MADPEQLEQVGLTLYERKALMALMLCGVADAATLCREGSVPTSKIYLAMEKLAGWGSCKSSRRVRRCSPPCRRSSCGIASSPIALPRGFTSSGGRP